MLAYAVRERVQLYAKAFPKWPPLRADDRCMDGLWMLGNNYKGSGYYGAYPPNYLRRLLSMFPDAEKVLHLFAGSLPAGDYMRFDIQGEAEVIGDAHCLSELVDRDFDLVLADPPYSGECATRYGVTMINRNTVIRECAKIVRPGGFVAWLDQVWPMYRKDEWHLRGMIGVVRSTNHRVRVVTILERRGAV